MSSTTGVVPSPSSQSPHAEAIAAAIAAAAPCSVELPAGAGKTELVAQLSAAVAATGGRSLILTHTHAGVDALRRRLHRHQVPLSSATVGTIDSWSLNLARRMPLIGEMPVPDPPDWNVKPAYCAAAARVVGSHHVRRVLQLSYRLAIVDEYQDCSLDQHAIVEALGAAIPVVVLGDRLQGLFDFDRHEPPVRWTEHVQALFPDYPVASQPWRWRHSAPDLGEWLSSIREPLLAEQPVDVASSPALWGQLPPAPGDRSRMTQQVLQRRFSGSVVGVGHFRNDLVTVARRLGGAYQVMEPLHGQRAEDFCDLVDQGPGPQLAAGAAEFAKGCIANVADTLSATRVARLSVGRVPRVQNPRDAAVLDKFSLLLTQAEPHDVLRALDAARSLQGSALHCAPLWDEVRSALMLTTRPAEPGGTRLSLAHNRSRASQQGRRSHRATLSAPTLIKGLEFDHAVVVNADGYTSAELYVALTRGRQSLTVLSRSPVVTPKNR